MELFIKEDFNIMVINMKKIFLIMFVFILANCNSQKLTIQKLNNIEQKQFHKELKEILKNNKDIISVLPNQKNIIIENEKFYFENRIKLKSKIIDSLQLLKKKQLITIETSTDSNGERREMIFVFFDNKIIAGNYIISNITINKEAHYKLFQKIYEVTITEFNDFEILKIYNIFKENKSIDNLVFENETNKIIDYKITKIFNGAIYYYSINAIDKYLVKKM